MSINAAREYVNMTPVRLDDAWIGPAASTLGRAFEDEPVGKLLTANPAERLGKTTAICRFVVSYGLRYGEVWTTSSRIEGVAVWLPSDVSDYGLLRCLPTGMLSTACRIGIPATMRIENMDGCFLRQRRIHAPFPHLYLAILGVDPMHQGKGYSRTLLSPILARLDTLDMPCALETQNERNVPLYEHFGFELLDRTTLTGLNMESWCMLRRWRGMKSAR
jgi:GNAT superfamily N-acetyltransferase